MGFFNITWNTQITRILPPIMRGVNVIDFVSSLVEGLQFNSSSWSDFEDLLRKRARYNGKKAVLQTALNEIMGVTVAPFILVDWRRGIASPTFFHPIANASTSYFHPIVNGSTSYFHSQANAGTGKDFTVLIPAGLNTPDFEQKVNSEVIAYKIAGVTYDIITY